MKQPRLAAADTDRSGRRICLPRLLAGARSRAARLGLTVGLLVLICLGPQTHLWRPAAAAGDEVLLDVWVQTEKEDFLSGQLDGVVVESFEDGALRLQAGHLRGTYTSAPEELGFPCQAAGLLYRSLEPVGTQINFELRALDQDGNWSPWMAVPMGTWPDAQGRTASEALVAFPLAGRLLQYRATFVGRRSLPLLKEVSVVYMAAEGAPTVSALPPWREDDLLPNPLPPEDWGGQSALTPKAALTGTLRFQVLPAVLSADTSANPAGLLQMSQQFHQQALGQTDLPYAFLIDAQGHVYQGRSGPIADVLYIGVLGSHPHESYSPTVEDALLALLPLLTQEIRLSEISTGDPLQDARLLSRWQAGNLRQSTRFLPRGQVGAEQHEWILLANPSTEHSQVTAQLYPAAGNPLRDSLWLPAQSRASLFANQFIEEGTLWTQMQASEDIVVERALYFGHDGDAAVALDALSREWYLPGGSQESGFSTTLSLLNPGQQEVTATVTVFAPDGLAAQRALTLAPRSRLDLAISRLYTGSTPVGCRVTATQSIAVEQQVRFSAAEGGYAMPGSPLLSQHWTLAGIETEASFVTLLALLNPHQGQVPFTLTLMSEDGTTLRRGYVLQPGQQVLNLNTILPELALAAEVVSEQGIAVARITLFNEMNSAHATLAAARPARRWEFAEGSTAEPFETLLLVANPNRSPTLVRLDFMGPQGPLDQISLYMPAHARMTVSLNQVLPHIAAFSTHLEADWPVVAERTMYLHNRQGGHASLGVPR